MHLSSHWTRWIGVTYVAGLFGTLAGLLAGPAWLQTPLLITSGIFFWPGPLVAALIAVPLWHWQHRRMHQRIEAEHGPQTAYTFEHYCARCQRHAEQTRHSTEELVARDIKREQLLEQEMHR